jgi:thymidylate synthase (FAD)
MILIKPQFELLHPPRYHESVRQIEFAGRTCYKSVGDFTIEGAERFIKTLIQNKHDSVLEHHSITAVIQVDRGVSHELVRHRLASYSQESTRYCNYKGGVTYVIPPWVDIKPGEYTSWWDMKGVTNTADWRWLDFLFTSEKRYQQLLQDGWTPQQARSVLPNSLKTEIVVTANIREWRHILKLRTGAGAHPQMKEIMVMLLNHFKGYYPIFFEDI